MRYYVQETQHRADGDVNFINTEKYDRASALAYYHSRVSAYYVDTTYPSASVCCMDENLNVVKKEDVPTKYVAPTA